SLGFEFELELRPGCANTLRLKGRVLDRIRFFSTCRPAIARKMHAVFGKEMNLDPEPVLAVEPGPVMDVVDIQTSTRTFYAAGLATHNCYARPSHEYLGFSAGLDFERKIMVKERAPELLREAFASPRSPPPRPAISRSRGGSASRGAASRSSPSSGTPSPRSPSRRSWRATPTSSPSWRATARAT